MKGIIVNIIEELMGAKLSSGAWDDEELAVSSWTKVVAKEMENEYQRAGSESFGCQFG